MKKLRFKGFSEKWQEFELGNIGELKTSSVDKIIVKGEKIVKLLNYMDVYKNSYITNNFNFAITSATENELKSFDLKYGDILFTPSSETPDDIAHSSVILENLNNVLYSYHLMRLRPKINLNNTFAGQVFKHNNFLQQCYNLAQGNTRFTLSISKFSCIKVKLPSLKEQEKIGELFKNLDESINKTELKISKLKQSKKALLDKLFTKTYEIHPQLRFKTFSEKWQEFELGNIALIYQPNTISQTNFLSNGYLVYGANGVIGFYDKYNHETEQIAIACRGNSCGVVNLTQAKSWITGNAMVVNVDDFKNINKFFLFTLLKNDKLDYLVSGSGQPQITSDIKIHKVKLPSLREQEKIGELFKALDESINLYEKKLSKLKQIKLALLEKIFKGE